MEDIRIKVLDKDGVIAEKKFRLGSTTRELFSTLNMQYGVGILKDSEDYELGVSDRVLDAGEYRFIPSVTEAPPSKKARFSETDIDDVATSSRYFEELLKPPETLPRTVGELKSFLSQIPVKFRVHPSLYKEVHDPHLLDVDPSDMWIELTGYLKDVLNDLMASNVGLSEPDISSDLRRLTGKFIERLNHWGPTSRELTNLHYTLDKISDKSMSSLRPLIRLSRPNFQLWVKSCLILRWENKVDASKAGQAMHENISKMCAWSPMFYGSLPYVIGGFCAGRQFTWLKLFGHNGGEVRSEIISRQYDLGTKGGVLQFLYSNVKIHCLLQKLQEHVGVSRCHVLYLPLTRRNGVTISFYPDKVVKTIEVETIVGDSTVSVDKRTKKLESLYESIEGSTFLIQGKRFTRRSQVVLHLTPVGDPHSKPADLSELEKAAHDLLHGLTELHAEDFTHRDLRWENCIKVIEGGDWKWVIIDMEDAGCDGDEWKDDDVRMKCWDENTLERAAQSQRYTKGSDMYLLGKLISTWLTDNPHSGNENLREVMGSLAEQMNQRIPVVEILKEVCNADCKRCLQFVKKDNLTFTSQTSHRTKLKSPPFS